MGKTVLFLIITRFPEQALAVIPSLLVRDQAVRNRTQEPFQRKSEFLFTPTEEEMFYFSFAFGVW